ncbi:MAG: DNA primase [Elusimicrobia bacterium]|nr:DNA primase [Candidatus Obscuribacterium magneticum]
MYSREQLDQVRSAIDLVALVREYVPSLKVAGRSIRGLCPFHNERTPSFFVHPEKGLFKCFGCGEGGDVFAFLSKMENVGFSEAVERLAEQAGIPLRRLNTPEVKKEEGLRDQLFRVLEAAARFYEDQLWGERSGEAVRAYLTERAVSDSTARTFRLGAAPVQGGGVFETLVKKGFPIDLCQKAGLVSKTREGRYYDPLFGRLVFPIFDSFGHIVGFGGRDLPHSKKRVLGLDEEAPGDQGPKYLNSPETPVFSKGKLLYGLTQGKSQILSRRQVLVLEGYMDVVAAHQSGFSFGVATLGTALTRDHARLIKRYADEVIAFFDPDEAGRKAALRGLEPILEEELFPRVVLTEGDLDPDEYLLEKGGEAFSALIDRAPDFVDYILKIGATASLSLKQKSDMAGQLVSLIAHSPNEILQSEWVKRVAFALGLHVVALERELKKARTKLIAYPTTGEDFKRRGNTALPTNEEELLQLLIAMPGLLSDSGLTSGDFRDERARRVFLLLQKHLAASHPTSVAGLLDEVPEADKEWLMNLALDPREFPDPSERLAQLLRGLHRKQEKEQLTVLSRRVATGEADEAAIREYQEMLRRVKGSVPVGPSST